MLDPGPPITWILLWVKEILVNVSWKPYKISRISAIFSQKYFLMNYFQANLNYSKTIFFIKKITSFKSQILQKSLLKSKSPKKLLFKKLNLSFKHK